MLLTTDPSLAGWAFSWASTGSCGPRFHGTAKPSLRGTEPAACYFAAAVLIDYVEDFVNCEPLPMLWAGSRLWTQTSRVPALDKNIQSPFGR